MKSKRTKQVEALARWQERLTFVSGPAENKKGDLTQEWWAGRKKVAEDQIARLKVILGGGYEAARD